MAGGKLAQASAFGRARHLADTSQITLKSGRPNQLDAAIGMAIFMLPSDDRILAIYPGSDGQLTKYSVIQASAGVVVITSRTIRERSSCLEQGLHQIPMARVTGKRRLVQKRLRYITVVLAGTSGRGHSGRACRQPRLWGRRTPFFVRVARV